MGEERQDKVKLAKTLKRILILNIIMTAIFSFILASQAKLIADLIASKSFEEDLITKDKVINILSSEIKDQNKEISELQTKVFNLERGTD